jgi:tyrosyl-tRNA synthetase
MVVPRENSRIVFQSEWFGKFGLRDVIELAGRFTAQQMLQREEFRKRMEKKTPIPIKDLLYPLLQAYDSVAIEADVEMGGTDQLFNILAGRELQSQLGQPPQQVFTVPLLEGLDGEKMSKSKPKTGIWLTDEPNEIYGKVMSIDDTLMPHYYEWATDLEWDEVKKINAALASKELGPKAAKERLAWQITSELHSPAKAEQAAAAFKRQFTEGQIPDNVEEVTIEANGSKEMNVIVVLMKGLKKSRSESRRLVEQGGVSVDGSKSNVETVVSTDSEHDLKYGKRSHARIRWR